MSRRDPGKHENCQETLDVCWAQRRTDCRSADTEEIVQESSEQLCCTAFVEQSSQNKLSATSSRKKKKSQRLWCELAWKQVLLMNEEEELPKPTIIGKQRGKQLMK